MCEAGREEPFDELPAWIFLSDADPGTDLPVISAPQLDRARNVQFRHFHIDSERHDVGLMLVVPDFHAFQAL